MTRDTRPGASTLLAFAVMVILGGSNFVAVRFSNQELMPFWGAGLRFALAALIFIVAALASRLPWPRGSRLLLTMIYGFFTFALTYALMYWALLRVTAGLAALVVAVVPLFTPLLAAAQRIEKLQPRAVLGAVIALGGILLMTVGVDGLVLPLSGLIAMLFAAVAFAESVILGKRVSENHPVMTNAVAMPVGAVLLLLLSVIQGERWAWPAQAGARWSLIYLVTLGSVGLFAIVLLVVRRWTASATAYAFVVFPVVAMLGDAWLLQVPLTIRGLSGAAVVAAGVWFGAFAATAPPAESPAVEAAAPAS